jgi:hypothetical protein
MLNLESTLLLGADAKRKMPTSWPNLKIKANLEVCRMATRPAAYLFDSTTIA